MRPWLILWILGTGILLNAAVIKPIPEKIEVDASKVQLGRSLFFDPILSKNNTVSCATCHDLQHGGDDGLQFSFGVDGKRGNINALTVYNAVFNFRQFWDGHAKDLEDQVAGPVSNPVEMGLSMEQAARKLKKSAVYARRFKKIYPDGVTAKNIANAIAEYEKTLITPNAPFDRYLRGDEHAISADAKRGYLLFRQKGCIICHNGVNVGGNLYNKFGIYKETNSSSLGRYNITHRESDKHVFKVPSLRNVALTAPYMHDGSVKTLHEAVVLMSEYQLGRYMKEDEIRAIEAFLRSLTGEIPQSVSSGK